MKAIAAVMAEMKEAGAPLDAIMVAVSAIDEYHQEIERLRNAEADKRQKKTFQKRVEREVSREVEATVARLSRDIDGDKEATVAATVAAKPSSPPPPKRYNQTPTSTPTLSVEARARAWFSEEFWPGWPHKVGRSDAERAAIKLFRQRRGDMLDVIAGRDRYMLDKPADRPWLNPATFLNRGRFDDRPAAQPPARAGPARRSADGLDEARRMLRERHGTDHNEESERPPVLADAGPVRPRADVYEPDGNEPRGQLFDLQPVRTVAGTTWRS